MDVKNLFEKFSKISNYWQPFILGELNDQYVKIAKLFGKFDRHKHDDEDELFFVIKGILKIQTDEKLFTLHSNELLIIPKNTYHQPIAEEEVYVLLFEPKTTLNTGNMISANTHAKLDWI